MNKITPLTAKTMVNSLAEHLNQQGLHQEMTDLFLIADIYQTTIDGLIDRMYELQQR